MKLGRGLEESDSRLLETLEGERSRDTGKSKGKIRYTSVVE